MSSHNVITSAKGDLLMKVRIPELNVQRIAKVSWDMKGMDAVANICKRHRYIYIYNIFISSVSNTPLREQC
tara:strand:- start:380 stop:592 length:213 start_codon:yes stop_codon:yes gene_type:complete